MIRLRSIRVVLGATIAVMGSLLLIMSALNLQAAMHRNEAAGRSVVIATLTRHIFDAGMTGRVERAMTLGALAGPAVASAPLLARIADFRGQSETSYAEVASQLNPQAVPELAGIIPQLSTARAAMVAMRAQADVLVQKPRSERPPAFLQAATAASAAYTDLLLAADARLEQAMQRVTPDIDDLLAIKHFTWLTRLKIGGQALRIEAAVAGQHPWTAADATASAADGGQAEMAWSEVSGLAAGSRVRPEIKEAVAGVGASIQTRFAPALAEEAHSMTETPAAPALPFADLQALDTSVVNMIADAARGSLRTVGTLAAAEVVTSHRLLALNAAVLVAAAALSLGGWLIVARRVAAPIGAMTAAMRRLADNELATEVPGMARRDEIGAMAHAVQVLKDNTVRAQALEQQQAQLRERRAAEDERVRSDAELAAATQAAELVVGSIGAGLARLAGGDLTFRLETPLPAAYETLRTDLNATSEHLQSMVRTIVANSAGLRSGTQEITLAADDLSRRTETQAASLEETAAALALITATVRKTADGAKHASAVVLRTSAEAEQSGAVVRQAVAAMGGIEQSSQQIGQIVGVIDEIAFQTNLLALNAGIEAARVGDAGRGFAVVAQEVRALSQRSAEAARDIKTLISASAAQVDAGVKLVGDTGQALARIMAQVAEIAGAVSAIAESADEQASGLNEVNAAVNQMDQMTQQNAAMVEQSTAASHSLAQDTAELVQLTMRFQTGDAPARPSPRQQPPRRPHPHTPIASRGRGNLAVRAAEPIASDAAWQDF